MKLQVNNSGAWKNVLTFGVEHLEPVTQAAQGLTDIAMLAGEAVTWRILDATETPVLIADKFGKWKAPVWMLGREIVP
ncbi:MAG: hypothetical protein IAE86_06840 [Burkholderiaceae bacterium]|nr:hypothetical protein [Burkholderiaceae bacterium]